MITSVEMHMDHSFRRYAVVVRDLFWCLWFNR